MVGYSYLADNVTRHAFTWTATGGMVDLGTLPGGTWSQGEAINASGEISGEGTDARGKQVPFFWSPVHGFHSLGENVGDPRNYGFSINDRQALTGQQYSGSVVNALIWSVSSPTIEYLPPLPGGLHMVGYDINNQDHITGNGSLADGRYAALIWTQERGTTGIGTITGASVTLAHAINDNDEVTGIAYLDSTTSGFIGNAISALLPSRPWEAILAAALLSTSQEPSSVGAAMPRVKFTRPSGITIPARRKISVRCLVAPQVTPIPSTVRDKSPASPQSRNGHVARKIKSLTPERPD